MIIVGVLKADRAVRVPGDLGGETGPGPAVRVMVLLVLITAVASALLDNVTTVLLVAPVTLAGLRRLGVPAVPFLIAEVLASNIGGTATLIGDPPNIIIASRAGLSFNDFLVNLAPIVRDPAGRVRAAVPVDVPDGVPLRRRERVAEVMALDEREAIRDAGLLVRSAWSCSRSSWSGSSCTRCSHLEPVDRRARSAPAAGRRRPGSDPDELRSRRSSGRPWSSSWACSSWSARWSRPASSTQLGERPTDAVGGNYFVAATVLLLWARPCCPAIVDNIPYVATMARSSPTWSQADGGAAGATCCGGRWRSAPTSAATPPPSAPAPTSSSSASPTATGTGSRSGSSPSTAHRHRRHRGDLRAVPVAALLPVRHRFLPDDVRVGRMGRTAVNALDVRLLEARLRPR